MPRTLCIFGDSITWGTGASDSGGWADQLKVYYQSTDSDVQIFNLGIPGDTAEDVLLRFQSEAGARQGTIALFAIGINDAQLRGEVGEEEVRVTDEEFKANILELVGEAARREMQVAFIGITRVDESRTLPVAWRSDRHYLNERIDLFDSIIRDICEDKELPYLSVASALESEDLTDGLHPNTAGYDKLFGAILPFLEARLGL